MAPYNNLIGRQFGKLRVISDTGERKHAKVVWLCKCKCGNIRQVIGSQLTGGKIYQCEECAKSGQQKNARARNIAHSLKHVYVLMKERCENPKCQAYPHYGGRGIHVCKEWKENKEAFVEWAISNGYAFGLTLERIDINGDYCPENCKWIPFREQSFNRRNTVYVMYHGKKIALAKICYDLNLDLERILRYLNKKKKYFE